MNVWFCVERATLTTYSSNFLADPLHLSLLLPAHSFDSSLSWWILLCKPKWQPTSFLIMFHWPHEAAFSHEQPPLHFAFSLFKVVFNERMKIGDSLSVCMHILCEPWLWSLWWCDGLHCLFTDANVPWERVLRLTYDAQPACPQTGGQEQRGASETGHWLHWPVLHLHQKVSPVCSAHPIIKCNSELWFWESKLRGKYIHEDTDVSHFWQIKPLTCKPFHITVKVEAKIWKMGKILTGWRFELC